MAVSKDILKWVLAAVAIVFACGAWATTVKFNSAGIAKNTTGVEANRTEIHEIKETIGPKFAEFSTRQEAMAGNIRDIKALVLAIPAP